MNSPQQKHEFALRYQIGFAGLINQFGDFPHGAMDRQVLQLHVNRQSEQQSQKAEENTDEQESVTVQATDEFDRGQIRQFQRGFPANFTGSARLCDSHRRRNKAASATGATRARPRIDAH